MTKIWSIFQALGTLPPPYWLLSLLSFILNGFRSSRLYRFKHPSHENWALITGASDGIGLGFAHELASRGFHIILHGRNAEKLAAKESALRSAYPGTKTKLWIADATKDVDREALARLVEDLHLTLLVNNVGGLPPGFDEYASLDTQPSEHIDRTIAMNLGFATKVTAALLPVLCKNQPSCILNISSLAALGSPLLTVYTGSKGYLNVHSLSLQCEMNGLGKDVTVHSILVGKVISNSLRNKPAFATPDSRTMAQATLDNIGLGSVVMTPYLPHWFQSKMFGLLPEKLALKLIWDATIAAREEDLESRKKE